MLRNRIIIILITFCTWSFCSYAQNIDSSSVELSKLDSLQIKDTIILPVIDYYQLLDSLTASVEISDSLKLAMGMHLINNMDKKNTFYRLRIFFDNNQNARSVSDDMMVIFKEKYPDIPIYRIYDNPYWRLTVGDFKAKSDALKLMDILKKEYPSIFLVREV